MKQISRREFGALLAAGIVSGRVSPAYASSPGRAAAITAGEVVDRIRSNVGIDWAAETVDAIKAGEVGTVVTGVVTTAMATMDVLRRAAAAGANLVVTSQPTFYGRADGRSPRAPQGPGQGPGGAGAAAPANPPVDPIYTAKNELIDGSGMVVFRLSDHWRRRPGDPFAQGMAETLGLGSRQPRGEVPTYEASSTNLATFASDLKRKLGARGGVRVIGDPGMPIHNVALLPGTHAIASILTAIPAADVVVAGEIREWESSEYARDVLYSGRPKALILVGRVVSEDPGMALCARWMETIVPEVPIRHFAAGDPYWRPVS